MQIVCPDCKFAREVDETKIPAKSQVATCPKCKTKFKFRELPEEETSVVESPQPEQVVQPEQPEQPVKPTQPAQATLPLHDEPSKPPQPSEPAFPKLSAPGEDPKEELWDKLGDMTPPEEKPVEPVEEQPVIHREQPAEPVEQEPVPGWTGEFNPDFPDPMQGDFQEEETEEESTMQVPPPFEQLDRYGFFPGLFMTVKLILTSPRLFFSVMPVGGGLAKPLTFAILVAMTQALAQFVWGAAGITPTIDLGNPDMTEAAFNMANGFFELLLKPAVVAVSLFIITGFYHILLIITQADSRGFEGSFRAVAYAYAPILLGIFPMPTLEIMAAWMAVYAFWGLFITALGLKHIHKASYAKIIPVVLMPFLLGAIAALTMFQSQLPTI